MGCVLRINQKSKFYAASVGMLVVMPMVESGIMRMPTHHRLVPVGMAMRLA